VVVEDGKLEATKRSTLAITFKAQENALLPCPKVAKKQFLDSYD